MAKKRGKKRRTTKRRSTKRNNDTPGWLWGVLGLAIGLSVALAVYVKDRQPGAAPRPVAETPPEAPAAAPPEPTARAGTLDDNGEAETSDDGGSERRFTFYEMLLKSEVVVTDEESGSSEPVAVVEPGTYALQVGSFSTEADADRRRAELALQGIESNIQKASVDKRIYYRVRIGPTDNLDELNLLRSRLRAARIDAMIVREVD